MSSCKNLSFFISQYISQEKKYRNVSFFQYRAALMRTHLVGASFTSNIPIPLTAVTSATTPPLSQLSTNTLKPLLSSAGFLYLPTATNFNHSRHVHDEGGLCAHCSLWVIFIMWLIICVMLPNLSLIVEQHRNNECIKRKDSKHNTHTHTHTIPRKGCG